MAHRVQVRALDGTNGRDESRVDYMIMDAPNNAVVFYKSTGGILCANFLDRSSRNIVEIPVSQIISIE